MTAPEKINLFKLHKQEYKAAKTPSLVEVAPAQYLMIDGHGDPSSPLFEACIRALYSVAYTIKMRCKAAGRTDYVVSKLECTWVPPENPDESSEVTLEQFSWTMMIRTPEHISDEDLRQAVEVLMDKGKAEKIKEVRLENMAEGICIQMLHMGPYENIHESVVALHTFAEQNQVVLCGKHHEIYISDPRRAAPEKLKTLLRQPIAG